MQQISQSACVGALAVWSLKPISCAWVNGISLADWSLSSSSRNGLQRSQLTKWSMPSQGPGTTSPGPPDDFYGHPGRASVDQHNSAPYDCRRSDQTQLKVQAAAEHCMSGACIALGASSTFQRLLLVCAVTACTGAFISSSFFQRLPECSNGFERFPVASSVSIRQMGAVLLQAPRACAAGPSRCNVMLSGWRGWGRVSRVTHACSTT